MSLDTIHVMNTMRDALIASAPVVTDNFGRSFAELKPEYKGDAGQTVRTIIDTNAQEIIRGRMTEVFSDAVYNLEEAEVNQTQSLDGKLLFFGDPFDGTANGQPRLPLSTQGLIAAVGNEYIAATTLHPFEKYMICGAKGKGVFRVELVQDADGKFHIVEGSEKQLKPLVETYGQIASGKIILMAAIDAIYAPINFGAQRKSKWTSLFVETLDKAYGGPFNAQMMREMGSNIDYAMKLAEGRLHVQLTDCVGGVYDIAPGAVFLPELGGVITDMHGNPLTVPATAYEMKEPKVQVAIASIDPRLHEKIVDITQKCYGANALYSPKHNRVFTAGEYGGFKQWDPAQRQIAVDIGLLQK